MKRSFDDVSVFEVIVVLGFFALMVMSCVDAHAFGRSPPPKEAPEINIETPDITVVDNGSESITVENDLSTGAEASSSASNDGNSQEIGISQNYEDSPFRMVLGIGGGSLYTQDHSNMDCQKQVKPERDWFGMHKHGEVVETDEECMRERRILRTVQTFMALDRPDLALRYLCSEMALGCPEPNLYGGGDKADIDPDYVESLEEEVGQWRKQAVHGDLYK